MTAVPDPAREAHKTHAEATRARRDIVSGEVMGEARLLRFVLGPDGALLPDFARKLPGRGMWVEARREGGEHSRQAGRLLPRRQDQGRGGL